MGLSSNSTAGAVAPARSKSAIQIRCACWLNTLNRTPPCAALAPGFGKCATGCNETALGSIGGGSVRAGELVLEEAEREGVAGRRLPCGFCARWTRGVGEGE